MAEPKRALEPLIEPQAPAAQGTAAQGLPADALAGLALPLAAVFLGLALLAGLGLWLWRRSAAARALRQLERRSSADAPTVTAQALAAWARQHAPGAEALPADWWAALDRLRFARPEPTQAADLAGLMAQARASVRSQGAPQPQPSRQGRH